MLWLVEKNQGEREISLFHGSKYLVLIGLILLASGGAIAEDTGKIVGKVTDAKTGEGLPGADIEIIGKKMKRKIRMATDYQTGKFEIENVPAGTYTLKAGMIGFRDTIKTGVRIISGQTTTQDFKLGALIICEGIRIPPQKGGEQKQGRPSEKATGKVIGKVIDAKAGDALPGSSVTLVGTKFRDVTNLVGDYYIIKVSPGTYVISAEMLGFKKPEMEEVRVVKDKTTVKNFKLEAIITHPPY